MDSITYNKLEYITSGSGLTPNELNEIVDLMEQYANEHVTEALHKHGVMQAEGSDVSEGCCGKGGLTDGTFFCDRGECKVRGENNECKGTAYCGYKKHTFL